METHNSELRTFVCRLVEALVQGCQFRVQCIDRLCGGVAPSVEPDGLEASAARIISPAKQCRIEIDLKSAEEEPMNLQELRALVDYHYWARDRLLDAAGRLSREQLTRDLGNSFPSIRDALVHLYGAERIWCARWEGESPQSMPSPNDFPDLPGIGTAWAQQEQRVRAVLEKLGEQGVARPITYQTMNGEPQAQPFWQMLQHLVNHGSYHRGQVTTMMRQLGVAPPKGMDLIAFYRERGAAAVR